MTIIATPFVLRDPSLIPRREWLYGRHLIRQFCSATIAHGGVGKSSLLIVEALAMATGRHLLGVKVSERCRVWYWCGEDPIEELERRFTAACVFFDIKAADLDGWLFVNSGRNCEIVIATQTKSGTDIAVPVIKELLATITANDISVVVIDPFVSSHRVSENDNGAIELVVKQWCQIADVTKVAIDLSHHSRKTGSNDVGVEDGRGASALLAAVRSARALNVMSPDQAKEVGIITRRRSYFRVEDGKANMALPSDQADWYELRSIQLGNGPTNNPNDGDLIAVANEWNWPKATDGVTDDDFDKVAVEIKAGLWRANSQAKSWVGFALIKALGLNAMVDVDRAKVRGLLKVWIGTGKLIEVTRIDPESRRPKQFVEVAAHE